MFPDNKHFLPFATICKVVDDELKAAVWLENYTGKSAVIHVAAKSNECDRKFLRTVFNYCFNDLKLTKLIGTVSSSNVRATEFDKRLGFVEEYRIKDTEINGDTIILTMTPSQCKLLRHTHGQESTEST